MKAFITALTAILCVSFCLSAAGPPPTPFTAVEIDRFVAAAGVAFPADYQSALVEDIAREVSLAFPSVIIVRQGEALPFGHAVLRISGTVIEFKPGNRAKRQLIGMGAGATVVETQVWSGRRRYGDTHDEPRREGRHTKWNRGRGFSGRR